MSNAVAALIRRGRKRLGLSQQEFGKAIGVSRAAVNLWEKGNKIADKNKMALARVLGVDAGLFLPSPSDGTTTGGALDMRELLFSPNRLMREDITRRVPVYRTLQHSEAKPPKDSDFLLSGEIVDQVTLPPRLAQRVDVRALWIHSDRMEPRYFSGELIYCGSIKPPTIGDFIVVVLKSDQDLKPVLVRQFIRSDGGRVYFTQFNPKKAGSVDLDDVEEVLRILPTAELAGV